MKKLIYILLVAIIAFAAYKLLTKSSEVPAEEIMIEEVAPVAPAAPIAPAVQ